MQTTTIEFNKNARRVYTAVRSIFEHRTKFSSIKCYDDLFVIEARHGAWLSPFSEKVKIRIVATGTQSSKAIVESSSRSVLNLLNFGANKANVSDLGDYICNEVYRLMDDGEIPMTQHPLDGRNHSEIRIVNPEILMK